MRLKHDPVPAEEVLSCIFQFAATGPGRQVGDTPVRSFALAVDAKACCLGLYDEAVVLQLTKPICDVVSATTTSKLVVGIALAQIHVSVVLEMSHPERRE
jgi:hypothetical protein